jgi:hypothetical protein
MATSKILFLLYCGAVLFSCTSREKYKRDLQSENINKVDKACFELGEAKDSSAVKLLLTHILDPRMSTNINYKGKTVNYCRLTALKKISGVDMGRQINQFWPDTPVTLFYLDWAVKNGHIGDTNEIDIYYYK